MSAQNSASLKRRQEEDRQRAARAREYAKGYQSALADILTKLEDEGEQGVRQWISDNYDGAGGRIRVCDEQAQLSPGTVGVCGTALEGRYVQCPNYDNHISAR